MKRRMITPEEIEASKTSSGGFTSKQLRAWGVRSPPVSGWRKRILRDGVPATCPMPVGFKPVDVTLASNPLLSFGPKLEPTTIPADAITIYADGSFDPGSKHGGWGFVALEGISVLREASGGASATTNNRMELQAVIEALRWLSAEGAVIIWTDSAYVFRGCQAIQRGWRRENWSRRLALANADLWRILEGLLSDRAVDVRWTRGHAGTLGNERADTLAAEGRRSLVSAAVGERGRP